jgi:hypothetical protein
LAIVKEVAVKIVKSGNTLSACILKYENTPLMAIELSIEELSNGTWVPGHPFHGGNSNSRLKKVKAKMNAQRPRGLDFFYPAHWAATVKGTAGEWPE